MKKTLTPGHLYSILASEFRQVCCARCRQCSLPLIFPVEEAADGAPSWEIGPLSRECEDCAREIAAIVSRNQKQYDLMDPVSGPMRPAQSQSPQSSYRH